MVGAGAVGFSPFGEFRGVSADAGYRSEAEIPPEAGLDAGWVWGEGVGKN
jgi:hypothetical protein